MEHAFWFDRWQKDQIGFHQADGQPLLRAHWASLGLAAGSRVLVPLCGKTRDMTWLADQGYRVTGVELSETAAADFFVESGVESTVARQGDFICYSAGAIEILVGDMLALPHETIATMGGWYDRASLIALPPPMRAGYADFLLSHLPTGARGLLITFGYDQQQMDGPPFSALEDEVRALMSGWAVIERLESRYGVPFSDHLHDKGLTDAHDDVYRLCIREPS